MFGRWRPAYVIRCEWRTCPTRLSDGHIVVLNVIMSVAGTRTVRRFAASVQLTGAPFMGSTRETSQPAPPPSARSRLNAALIRAKCVNACGKFPSASPLGPVCSAYSPRWLA